MRRKRDLSNVTVAMVVERGAPEAQVPRQEGREGERKGKGDRTESEASGGNMGQAGILNMAMSKIALLANKKFADLYYIDID